MQLWSKEKKKKIKLVTVRLTFALKHPNELRPHCHGYVGDEAGRNLLAVAQQVVARPQEQIRQVAQEVDEAPGCRCHVGWKKEEEVKVLRQAQLKPGLLKSPFLRRTESIILSNDSNEGDKWELRGQKGNTVDEMNKCLLRDSFASVRNSLEPRGSSQRSRCGRKRENFCEKCRDEAPLGRTERQVGIYKARSTSAFVHDVSKRGFWGYKTDSMPLSCVAINGKHSIDGASGSCCVEKQLCASSSNANSHRCCDKVIKAASI